MSKYENFASPPITEALIDIRIERPSDLSLESFDKAYESIRSDYPQKKTSKVFAGTFEIKDEEAPTSSSVKDEIIGYRYSSADNQKHVQFRLDGFTFNRLKPYKSWDEMSSEAKKLWQAYSASIKHKLIKRVAVRYINAIEIPSQRFELSEYFTLFPRLPDTIENQPSLEHFFTRSTIGFPSSPVKVNIAQTIGDSSKPNTSLFILDIDAFLDDINSQLSDSEIWTYFSQLQNIKNNVFFGCITDKTKELFRK